MNYKDNFEKFSFYPKSKSDLILYSIAAVVSLIVAGWLLWSAVSAYSECQAQYIEQSKTVSAVLVTPDLDCDRIGLFTR